MSTPDELSFLDSPEPVSETPAEVAAPTPEPTDAPAPVVDEDGRARDPATGKFAPKPKDPEPAPVEVAPAAEATPAPEPVQTPPEGYVPVAALQAIREELKVLKAAQAAPAPAPAAEPAPQPVAAPAAAPEGADFSPVPVPDITEDPEGYRYAVDANATRRITALSYRFAAQAHGQDAVNAAWKWGIERANQDPGFSQRLSQSQDPVGDMFAEHRRHLAVERLATLSPDALDRLLNGQPAGQPEPAAAAEPAPQPSPSPAPKPAAEPVAPPPRSIVASTSAGGMAHVPSGPSEAYDGLFRKG